MRSCWIEQAGELALVIVADLAGPERALALAQQQERIGRHPHDFVGVTRRRAVTCVLTLSEGPARLSPQPTPRDVLRVAYSSVVSPIVRESMSAVA